MDLLNSTSAPLAACPLTGIQGIDSLTYLESYNALLCTTLLFVMLGVTRKVKDCFARRQGGVHRVTDPDDDDEETDV